MRLGILGAGGIGGYYAGVLAAAGHDVQLLARGANLEALRERGLELRTPEGARRLPVAATDDPSALGPVDVALVTVKAYSLDEIAPAVRGLAARGADVVPLLNGVDAADRLEALGVPRARLLGGVTYISAARIAPGVFERFTPRQRVVVGELAGGASPRAERIAAAFRDAGVDGVVADDVQLALWQKFVFIVTLAAVCGIARSALGPVRAHPLGRRTMERALAEAVAVGRARGIAFPADQEARVLAEFELLAPEVVPSFLLDVRAGGPTELDVLSGAVSRLADSLRIPTPVHDTVTAAFAAGRADA